MLTKASQPQRPCTPVPKHKKLNSKLSSTLSDLVMADYDMVLASVNDLLTQVGLKHKRHPKDKQLSILLQNVTDLKNDTRQYPRHMSTLAKSEPLYQMFKEKYKDKQAFLECNAGSLDGYQESLKNFKDLESMRVYLRRKGWELAESIVEGLEKFEEEFEEVKRRLYA
ncbi:hypothetical protein N0V83_006813 [Neocucurbitaria cava]|uniref:Uncharacterized protein n=1 Tax=Neocucurbitaria cava TaxID=798079 RepID=A0A9W8Y8R2_9PLEO|nr:hypothetical protein N0V83_006813 [Neocucurbitaria cava]